MPLSITKPFCLRSGSHLRRVGFVHDQPPDGFVVRTVCEVKDDGKRVLEITLNYAYFRDAEERLDRARSLLAKAWQRAAIREIGLVGETGRPTRDASVDQY